MIQEKQRPSVYIKLRGIQAILVDCSDNLRDVRNHLLRETNVTTDKVYRPLADFKNYLKQNCSKLKWKDLLDEITRKIMAFVRKENYNDHNT